MWLRLRYENPDSIRTIGTPYPFLVRNFVGRITVAPPLQHGVVRGTDPLLPSNNPRCNLFRARIVPLGTPCLAALSGRERKLWIGIRRLSRRGFFTGRCPSKQLQTASKPGFESGNRTPIPLWGIPIKEMCLPSPNNVPIWCLREIRNLSLCYKWGFLRCYNWGNGARA